MRDGVRVDIMCGLHGAGFGFVVWETVGSYVSEQAEWWREMELACSSFHEINR